MTREFSGKFEEKIFGERADSPRCPNARHLGHPAELEVDPPFARKKRRMGHPFFGEDQDSKT